MIDQLIEQDQNGKRAGSGWKKEAWTVVVSNFNTRFKTNYNKDQMKSACPWTEDVDVVGEKNRYGTGHLDSTQLIGGNADLELVFHFDPDLENKCIHREISTKEID